MSRLEDVGVVIHVLRVIRDLSQGELAEASGVRNSSISNYERRKSTPKLETLQKLASGLDLPLSMLEDTQEFIDRVRSTAEDGSVVAEDGERGEPRTADEIEELAEEWGRLTSRSIRLAYQLLSGEESSSGPDGEGEPDGG